MISRIRVYHLAILVWLTASLAAVLLLRSPRPREWLGLNSSGVFKTRPVTLTFAKHFDRRYSGNPEPLTIWGPHLHTTSVWQRSYFFITLSCAPEQCDELYVWFQGPSIFTPTNITRNATTAVVEYVAADSGKFEVHVEILRVDRNDVHKNTVFKASASPLALTVFPTAYQQRVYSRVNFPIRPCPDAAWRIGRWIYCGEQDACPRRGWAWVPHECFIQHVDLTMLGALSTPLWIVLAGSSVQRGTFFALVDTILGERAKNLTESSYWKCWGFMDFTVGNFRVSYIDFRMARMFVEPKSLPGKPADIELNYQLHGIEAIRTMALDNGGKGPDSFYVEGGTGTTLREVMIVKSWFGPNWAGRFFVQRQKPVFGTKGAFTMDLSKPPLLQELDAHPGLGIEYIDEIHMAVPFMHTMESRFEEGKMSQHYHRRCSEGHVHSCSEVCDMAAQQLIRLLLPASSQIMSVPNLQAVPSNFSFCLDCPAHLVPFTIKPKGLAEAVCLDHVPKDAVM